MICCGAAIVADVRRLLTNFSKGELSPLIEGRPDLAAYFEGGSTIENWTLLRQGGLERRYGFRYVAEVKNSAKDTILIPFEPDIDTARIIEVGDSYSRFFKPDKTQILSGGVPYEIAPPWTEAQLRNIHFTQSVDTLFLFHRSVAQQKITRVSDTSWAVTPITYRPPAMYDADTDISAGATLTPAATTGTSVVFTASSAVFLEGDVGRMIVFGTARAVITAFGSSAADTVSPNTHVRADIIDAFPDTNPIASGSWLLRNSPQTTLDPDKKEPVGGIVTFAAGTNAFRAADVGKYILIYGGVVKITTYISATSIKGELLVTMGGTTAANPAAAPAGAWTLEINAWSASTGYPGTGEFVQGRLGQAGNTKLPTTWWLSASDAFDNYGPGVVANAALTYQMATPGYNRIEWLVDNDDIFIGTSGSEHRFTSGKSDQPFGGDITPLGKRIDKQGSAAIQPAVLSKRIIFIDRSLQKIYQLAFNIEQDGPTVTELTDISEHITGTGIRLGPIAMRVRPNPQIFYVRNDGELAVLTFYPSQKVIGFTRYKTTGTFESVACISQGGGKSDQLWALVKRTINGATKRYVEVQDENASEVAGRNWTSLQTDCAKVYTLGGSTTVLTGLSHLEGVTVDVIADNSYRGTAVVSSGQITIPGGAASSYAEVGIHYDSTAVTMRPSVSGSMLEGLPRNWVNIWVRLYNSKGGKVNDEELQYTDDLDSNALFTGDLDVRGYGTPDTSGKITVKQHLPYPMTLLAIFGEVQFGEHS